MNAGTLEQARNDFEHGVYNMTDNGKCTGCGNCCGNILPMTDKEIEAIRRYIKKHNIKECKHTIPFAKPILDMACPFLNTEKRPRNVRFTAFDQLYADVLSVLNRTER